MNIFIKNTIKYFILIAISCSFILSYVSPAAAEYKAPKPYNYVNDYSGVLSDTTENKLNSLLKEVSDKTGAEVAVVTLKSLDGYPIEDIGLSIGRQWGIGQKGKNNGVLIIVAPNDKKMRIEVGYGLEGAIPDSRAGRIRDELMIPEFKKGNYETGIIYATDEIAKLIAKEYNVQITGEYNLPQAPNQSSDLSDVILFFFILIFIIGIHRNKNTRSEFYSFLLGYGLGSIGSSSSSRYSGFGGGSSGFGGFGGGGFGGGGASGGW